MSLSTLPLSYCTNVHPGRSVSAVVQGLTDFAAPVQSESGVATAAGLWLAASVVDELERDPGGIERLSGALTGHGLVCYTLNAFPYGDFHDARVKERVYIPTWAEESRLRYTQQCARVLSRLLPVGTEGSISTVPLGFKLTDRPDDFVAQCIERLIELAVWLDELHDDTGSVIRLAIEPEPLCMLETTPETVEFFYSLRQRAVELGREDVVQRHIGVCYDVCHQAVEFEDVRASIALLDAEGIRINKLHITCAIRLERPQENEEARRALAAYVEPRYLHQTVARSADGTVTRTVDLSEPLALEPPEPFRSADEWRVHFHVPVNSERLGPLQTTRDDLKAALRAIGQLTYAPHLEVETYTWNVLPGGGPRDLVSGLSDEIQATSSLLAETR